MLRLHDEVSASAASRCLQLRVRLPQRTDAHGAPLLTHTAPVLLERCLRNLLDNAIKYTTQGTGLLALRPGRLGAEGGTAWHLQLWDTGDVSPERPQLLRDSSLPWLPKPVMPMRLRSWLAAQRGG